MSAVPQKAVKLNRLITSHPNWLDCPAWSTNSGILWTEIATARNIISVQSHKIVQVLAVTFSNPLNCCSLLSGLVWCHLYGLKIIYVTSCSVYESPRSIYQLTQWLTFYLHYIKCLTNVGPKPHIFISICSYTEQLTVATRSGLSSTLRYFKDVCDFLLSVRESQRSLQLPINAVADTLSSLRYVSDVFFYHSN